MRMRKYRRLLALLLLNLVLLGGMMTYAALRSDGYEVRVLPVSAWHNRERAWGLVVKQSDPMQAYVSAKLPCGNPLFEMRIRYGTPKDRTLYHLGIVRIGTPTAFAAAAEDESWRFLAAELEQSRQERKNE